MDGRNARIGLMGEHTVINRTEIDFMRRKQLKLEGEVRAVQASVTNHRCVKEADFSRIDSVLAKLQESIQSFASELGSWKFFKTIFISLLGVILAASLTAVYHFVQLQTEVTKIQSQAASSELEAKLDKIQTTLQTIEGKTIKVKDGVD